MIRTRKLPRNLCPRFHRRELVRSHRRLSRSAGWVRARGLRTLSNATRQHVLSWPALLIRIRQRHRERIILTTLILFSYRDRSTSRPRSVRPFLVQNLTFGRQLRRWCTILAVRCRFNAFLTHGRLLFPRRSILALKSRVNSFLALLLRALFDRSFVLINRRQRRSPRLRSPLPFLRAHSVLQRSLRPRSSRGSNAMGDGSQNRRLSPRTQKLKVSLEKSTFSIL